MAVVNEGEVGDAAGFIPNGLAIFNWWSLSVTELIIDRDENFGYQTPIGSWFLKI